VVAVAGLFVAVRFPKFARPLRHAIRATCRPRACTFPVGYVQFPVVVKNFPCSADNQRFTNELQIIEFPGRLKMHWPLGDKKPNTLLIFPVMRESVPRDFGE